MTFPRMNFYGISRRRLRKIKEAIDDGEES